MTIIFDLIMFLIIGLAAGAIASFYMGRQQELVPNLLIGIAGAFIGGFFAKLLGLTAYNVIGEVVVATASAIIWRGSAADCATASSIVRTCVMGSSGSRPRMMSRTAESTVSSGTAVRRTTNVRKASWVKGV